MSNLKVFRRIENKVGLAEGTSVFILSTLFIKVVGALYKIPLCNLLGGYGIGLYQTVFPVYALILTLSGAGIPTAMTKIISSGYDADVLLNKCLKIFCPLAFLFAFLLVVFAKKLCLLQGEANAKILYFAIAPSIVIVSFIACLRGYFQGKSNFKPTAVSQVIEQCVKAISGVIALLLVSGSVVKRAFFACLAVTFSEVVSLCYLALKFKRVKKTILNNNKVTEIKTKRLLSIILPITLATLFLPFSCFLDSITAINFLKNTYAEGATAVYGLYTGGVDTIISLPVGLLHCLSLGFLPSTVKNKGKNKSVLIVFFSSIACAFAVIVFSPIAVKIFFSGMAEYSALLTKLLRYSSVNVIVLATLQATNTYLVALSRQKLPLFSMLIGVCVKIILNFTIIKLPKINVFGMLISDFACYFVALLINLVYIIYIKKRKKVSKTDENHIDRNGCRQKCLG